MSGGVGRGVFGAWKWYNIRRFMGEKTQENLIMGYSAAYPTGRELGEKWGSDGVKSG